MKSVRYQLSKVSGLEVYRDGEFEVLGLSNSEINGDIITFAEDPKFFNEILGNHNITSVITKKEYVEYFVDSIQGIAISEKPRLAFFSLHNLLASDMEYALATEKTVIGENCHISNLCYIDPENVVIGNNVTIEEFVSIRGHCRIGDNTVIRSGCQIGGEGFEFKQNGDSFYNVTHCGSVVIGNNVIIWPNVTIHKAVYPWDTTYIGNNTNINSQVHIDHGAKIGKRSEICAGAIISGRCKLSDFSFVGPGAILSNRVSIGTNSRVSLGSVVTKTVEDGKTVTGNFAIDHKLFMDRLRRVSDKEHCD